MWKEGPLQEIVSKMLKVPPSCSQVMYIYARGVHMMIFLISSTYGTFLNPYNEMSSNVSLQRDVPILFEKVMWHVALSFPPNIQTG